MSRHDDVAAQDRGLSEQALDTVSSGAPGTSSAARDSEIVRVVGRWAKLDNGDHVTPVPAFSDLGYNAAEFDARIASFQADPAGELTRCGVVERVPAWSPKP